MASPTVMRGLKLRNRRVQIKQVNLVALQMMTAISRGVLMLILQCDIVGSAKQWSICTVWE